MEEKILNIMRDVFEDDTIDATIDQRNNENWDSLRHLNLISELEDEFDVEFEPEEIAEMTSFDKVKEILSSKC